MSRYAIKLVPQGVIPRPLDLGVRLQPLGAPPAPEVGTVCAPEWESWLVTVDAEAFLGANITDGPEWEPIVFDQAAVAWTATVTFGGTLCPGQCIDWTLVPITENANIADVVVTQECEMVTLTWAAEDEVTPFGEMIFAIYATIDGQPLGFPQYFQAGTVGCERVDTDGSWLGVTDNPNSPYDVGTPNLSTFPAIGGSSTKLAPGPDQATVIAQTCNQEIYADFSLNDGDPGAYGDFSISPTVDPLVWQVDTTGLNDYTGITLTVTFRYVDTNSSIGCVAILSAV